MTDTSAFVEALQRALPAIAEQQNANDPKKLKAGLERLKQELARSTSIQSKTINVQSDQHDQALARIGVLESDNRALEQHRDAVVRAFSTLQNRLDGARGSIDNALQAIGDRFDLPAFPTITKTSAPPPAARKTTVLSATAARPAATSAPRPRLNGHASGDSSLGKGERCVLTAITQHSEGVDREQITILTGYKRSTRDSYVQRLGAAGLIEIGSTAIAVTAEGIAALGSDFEPLPTGAQLRDYWLGRLPAGERCVFEALVEVYPRGLTREAISNATVYKRSTRDSYIQRLGVRKLVESRGSEVFASERLF